MSARAQLQYLHDELEKLKEQKLYQKLRVLAGEQAPVATFDGQRVIHPPAVDALHGRALEDNRIYQVKLDRLGRQDLEPIISARCVVSPR